MSERRSDQTNGSDGGGPAEIENIHHFVLVIMSLTSHLIVRTITSKHQSSLPSKSQSESSLAVWLKSTHPNKLVYSNRKIRFTRKFVILKI